MSKFLVVSLLLILSSLGIQAAAAVKSGDWAQYGMISARRNGVAPVKSITITIGPNEQKMRWWQLNAVNTDESIYAVRVLSQRVPMDGRTNDIGRVERYLFKDGDRPFVEFRDKTTREAMLPLFDFRSQLVPYSTPGARLEGGFATCGGYIGHPIHLVATGSDKPFVAAGQVKLLSLDPTLIIGTGRAFRDIEEGRVEGRDYEYRPFTQEEYDEMEGAGINFFLTDTDEREGWVRERAVFYSKYPSAADFPNIFYRSNYRGCVMFMDEPAVLMFLEDSEIAASRPPMQRMTDASNLVRFRVAEQYLNNEHYSSRVLTNHMKKVGVNVGLWDLKQDDVPSWETLYQTAYYQLEAGASGLVHEGRYRLDEYNAELAKLFGEDVTVTAEQMLQLHYAFMRGAARCFKREWGTSIYGQADPELSPLAMSMAYDMGARYLWFWTSDHDHHMPYAEQLDLTRKLRAHEKANPRQPVGKLRDAARAAVVFPEGYTYFSWDPWNSPVLKADRLNELGVSCNAIMAAAMREGIRLAKEGVPFDFVIEGEPVKKAGYRQVIRVGLDGEVSK